MIKRMVRSFLRAMGYGIWKLPSGDSKEVPRGGYDLEEDAREAIAKVRDFTMLPYPRLVTLWQQVAFCEQASIPGCFVECGTWKGGAAALMALANRRYGSSRRHIHLFDSFEGIPEPDERVDGAKAIEQIRKVGGGTHGRLVPVQGAYEYYASGVGTLEHNRRVVEEIAGYDKDYVHYHKGWFQDTVPKDHEAVGQVAILRLDGDWYASTKVCLEHLYGQVVPGGFVIVDDYACYEGCRRAVQEFLAAQKCHVFLYHVDSEARYWIKT